MLGVFGDAFEWEDGKGNVGRCLMVKTEELKEKASKLDCKIALITAYYPKSYEKTGELGVLIDVREAVPTDFDKHKSMLRFNLFR